MPAFPLRSVIIITLTAALAGCPFQEKLETFSGPTQGSTYTVKYVAKGGASIEQLKKETEEILEEVDQQMSTYRADSVIETFNDLPSGACMAVPDGVRELVLAGEKLSQESDGAFDLTIEPLLNLWGFGPKGNGEKVPTEEQIAETKLNVGYRHLRIDGEKLCKDAAIEVDFNSVAAGYSVDAVAAHLKKSGIDSYLIEITGELIAAGRKPDGSPWRIAIEAPHDNERVAQRVIELDGYGVSTSGDYRNYFEQDGKRYSHTLDPQKGAPIDHKLAAVTVFDRSTLRADGLSTVLMVLGQERGLAYAQERDIAAFFVIREGQGFVSKSTAAFDEHFGAGAEK